MNSFRSSYEERSKLCVLIANLTGVVAELIIQAIHQQPDIGFLGTVRAWGEVESLIGETSILIVGFEDEIFSTEVCLQLLNDYPQLKILILRANRDEGTVYWRVLHGQQMQMISAQTLIESIRYIHSLPYMDIDMHSSFLEGN